MSYTQEQIDRANQVNLEQFLRSQGEELVKSGREYRWKNHDSLTVKGNKWFRHSQSKGGYPIDFVMEFYDKTFPEAMQMLIGEEALEIAAEPGPKAEFRLPSCCESNDRIIKYLTEERKLPKRSRKQEATVTLAKMRNTMQPRMHRLLWSRELLLLKIC